MCSACRYHRILNIVRTWKMRDAHNSMFYVEISTLLLVASQQFYFLCAPGRPRNEIQPHLSGMILLVSIDSKNLYKNFLVIKFAFFFDNLTWKFKGSLTLLESSHCRLRCSRFLFFVKCVYLFLVNLLDSPH
jgi:hypothetical protein